MNLDGIISIIHNTMRGKSWAKSYNERLLSRNKCLDGCPPNSHCEWGICECNKRYQKSFGRCSQSGNLEPTPAHQAPFRTCSSTQDCVGVDINLVCRNNNRRGGKFCKCRKNMAWNKEQLECQVSEGKIIGKQLF